MTWLFYANLEELRRYFQQQKTSSENIADVKPEVKQITKQITLDDVVGLLAYDLENRALIYIPLDNLLKGKREYGLLRLEKYIRVYPLHDISIIPDRGLLALGNSPECYVSIYNNKGKLVKKFEEEDYVNGIFYNGRKYLYHAGKYGIKRIDLDTLVKETVVYKEDLEEINVYTVSWLQFKDGKWYILVNNRNGTFTLYSTEELENVPKWKRKIHWDIEHDYVASFDFLPDGSIISTVPLEYLDINEKERIEVSIAEHKDIYRLRALPLSEREAYVFYGGDEFIGYALLRKGYIGWEVVKSKHIEDLYRPVEIVTKEGYGRVVKPLLR